MKLKKNFVEKDRVRDLQQRENWRGRDRRGRGGPRMGRGRRWQPDQEGEWEGSPEMEENQNSRLMDSLINPQEVPRKGYFFEVCNELDTSLLSCLLSFKSVA